MTAKEFVDNHKDYETQERWIESEVIKIAQGYADQETAALRNELEEANERCDDLLTALTHDAENIADAVEEILDEYMVNVNDSDNITERLTQIINEIRLLSVKEEGGLNA